MKRLLIIGAGGFGREVLGWALDIQPAQDQWEVAGFLDSNQHALKDFSLKYPLIGDPLTFSPSPDDLLVCAIGDTRTKLRLCQHLVSRGAEFVSLIHPTVVMGPNCRIGHGCVLCPGVVLTTNVTLGNFVTLNVHATVGHDVVIGDGCTLNAHSDVTGCAKLGEGVFLGSHAVVLPNARVGDYAVVGAGSVVLKKVRPNTSVMGVPAKQISGFADSQ